MRLNRQSRHRNTQHRDTTRRNRHESGTISNVVCSDVGSVRLDLVIRGARLIDGTGAPARIADVGISGDRIAWVSSVTEAAEVTEAAGKMAGEAGGEIDGRGLTLLPGLIDPHSHADLIFPLPPARQAKLLRGKLTQGITTTIIGNCGLGCAPVASIEAEAQMRGIAGWMTPESIEWRWRSIGDYLARLRDNGVLLNVGTLIPQGAIRIGAMGLARGIPNAGELRQMRAAVERGLDDGAFGLSTGLIYPPGIYSATDELIELARVVAAHDGICTSHIRGSSELLLPAVKELIEIGRATGVRLHHSHSEAVGRAHWPKIDEVLALEDEARGEGIRLSFDIFPYTGAATMMIAIYPPWALEGGVTSLLERLRDPDLRRRIEREIELPRPDELGWPPWLDGGWPHNLVAATGWEAITIGRVGSRRHRQYEGLSLARLGALIGKSPFDAISDLLIEEKGEVSMIIFEISGGRRQRRWLDRLARHPFCAFCTDAEDYGRGLPHPAAYGAFPRILSKFTGSPPRLSLETAVHRMTLYPATLFGIADRGVIRPGAFADLVLCNPDKLRDRASFRHPRREATGIITVIINGSVVCHGDPLTGHGPNETVNGMVLKSG